MAGTRASPKKNIPITYIKIANNNWVKVIQIHCMINLL
jgi:hypothetical protein